MEKKKHLIFTIVTRSYLARAVCLGRSLEQTNPDSSFYILVADLLNADKKLLVETMDAQDHKIKILAIDELDYPPVFHMAVRYNAIEFCTAIKPATFLHLARSIPKAIISYIDPDIVAYGKFDELERELTAHGVVVMPHFLSPLEDHAKPTLVDIARVGVYNFGYVGINAESAEALELIRWWRNRLEYQCLTAPNEGTFHDQSWGSLFPCFVDSICILRHPGYNVAYWNLYERILRKEGERYTINGLDLKFFHFSGYNYEVPSQMSRHQSRFILDAMPLHRELFDDYEARLKSAGDVALKKLPYAWDEVNGTFISPDFRAWYRSLGPSANRYGQIPQSNPNFLSDLCSRTSPRTPSGLMGSLKRLGKPYLKKMPQPIQQAITIEYDHVRMLYRASRNLIAVQIKVAKQAAQVLPSPVRRRLRELK